jgi:hypothetical protein
MRTARTKSGLRGWRGRLRSQYASKEEWKHYAGMYGLARRLGYKSAEAAWKADPVIEGSVSPGDFRAAPKRQRMKRNPRDYYPSVIRQSGRLADRARALAARLGAKNPRKRRTRSNSYHSTTGWKMHSKGKTYMYAGRIEGHVVYKGPDNKYYIRMAGGRLRQSPRIDDIVAKGWSEHATANPRKWAATIKSPDLFGGEMLRARLRGAAARRRLEEEDMPSERHRWILAGMSRSRRTANPRYSKRRKARTSRRRVARN